MALEDGEPASSRLSHMPHAKPAPLRYSADAYTRGVMLSAALLLIYAIDDELDSDLTPKAKKNVNAELRKELFEKILGASGNRSHLIPFTAPEFREFRKCREDAKGDEVREGSDTAALHTDNIVPFKR